MFETKDIQEMKKAVEVTDDHILLGEPIELLKYGRDKRGNIDLKNKRKFIIRQVNWFYGWEKYTYWLAMFLMYYNQVIESEFLPDTAGDLDKFRDNVKTALKTGGVMDKEQNTIAFRSMCEMCKFTNKDVKWMKNNFTIDDWVEIFLYLYLYNVLGKKKGLRTVSKLIGLVLSSWSPAKESSTSGLKGVFPLKK